MKSTLIIALCCLIYSAKAQFVAPEEPKNDKPTYNYIIVWRTWEAHMVQHGDLMSNEYGWRTDFAGFNTEKELMDWINTDPGPNWINSSGYHPSKFTRIRENQFIMAYDFIHRRKIDFVFKTVNKSLPKRVEVEETKWTETTAEVKKEEPKP